MIVQPVKVEAIAEAALNQSAEIIIAHSRVEFDLCLAHEGINRALDFGEIVFVDLLVRAKCRAEQVLYTYVVLLGDSEQRFHKRACFGRLARQKLYDLRGRHAEQVIRKIVQHGRAEKVGKRTKLFVEPD